MNRTVTVAVVAVILAGCSATPSLPKVSFSSLAVVPGKSTQKDVEAAWGRPAEVMDGSAAGERVLFYNHAPNGGETHAVTLGRDGMVRAVEQRLTRENVQRIVCGRSTSRTVRALLGPPIQVVSRPRLNQEEWVYRLSTVGSDPILFHVAFARDGIARELYAEVDPAASRSAGNIDLLPAGNINCAAG